MHVISVNRGRRQTHMKGTVPEITGIYKLPVSSPVRIHELGAEGDFIGDSKNHGGPDQAIYVYGAIDYAWWETTLGRTLEPGTFGENLTITELESAGFLIGDRLQVGAVLLEVTSPRTPCATLAARMGDGGFVRTFRSAERPGLYCRVLRSGDVNANDPVTRIPFGGEPVSILEMFRHHYRRDRGEEVLRRWMQAPISARVRARFEIDLQRANAG